MSFSINPKYFVEFYWWCYCYLIVEQPTSVNFNELSKRKFIIMINNTITIIMMTINTVCNISSICVRVCDCLFRLKLLTLSFLIFITFLFIPLYNLLTNIQSPFCNKSSFWNFIHPLLHFFLFNWKQVFAIVCLFGFMFIFFHPSIRLAPT